LRHQHFKDVAIRRATWAARRLAAHSIKATNKHVRRRFKPHCNSVERERSMNTIQRAASRRSSALLAIVVSLASAGALLGVADDAQARQRATTVTGPNGKTATRNVDRSAGDVSANTAGSNGATSSRAVDRSAAGTTATSTGPKGKTASRATTRTATGSQTTVTGPNGQTGSATVTRP